MSDTGARLVASAIGAGVAESITLPTDVAKVRLQVQKNSSASTSSTAYRGMADCLRTIAREEGPAALWKGIQPALLRQVCYTSLSLVLYEPVRNFYCPNGAAPGYLQRLLAGGTAGAAAITVFNPTEVLKTQIQTSQAALSMREVASRVWEREGLVGFWAGIKPNIARTFLVNAAELGTYDEAKSQIKPYLGDGLATHVTASGVAGVASACTSTPADVVKTRFMDAAGKERAYRGFLHTGVSIFREEGPSALYKGFTPIVCRKIAWCTVFFVMYERIRQGMSGPQ